MSRPATPALDRWRAEMRVGRRQLRDRDALARAASEEMTALEAVALGLTPTAALARARELWPGEAEDPLDVLAAGETQASAAGSSAGWGARPRRSSWG